MKKDPKFKVGDLVCLFWQAANGEVVSNDPDAHLVIDVNPDATGPYSIYKIVKSDGLIRTRYEFELWHLAEIRSASQKQCPI